MTDRAPDSAPDYRQSCRHTVATNLRCDACGTFIGVVPWPVDEPVRVASTATAAPMLWHYLKDPADEIRRVRCGEVRREWLPVEEFAAPEVFDPCPRCLADSAQALCPIHGERLSGGDQCWTCFTTPGVES